MAAIITVQALTTVLYLPVIQIMSEITDETWNIKCSATVNSKYCKDKCDFNLNFIDFLSLVCI